MNLEAIYARHLVELGYLEDTVRQLGYTSQMIEASSDIPYHTLLVGLDQDKKGRNREMACNFYPLTAEEAENILLLQYFLELPFEIDSGANLQVNKLLSELNNRIVIGHFGVTSGANKIHHRYIQTFASSNLLSEEPTSEVVILFNYTSLLFGDEIEAVATKQKTAQEAMQVILKNQSIDLF